MPKGLYYYVGTCDLGDVLGIDPMYYGFERIPQDVVDEWEQRAERTCEGCVHDLPNGMSKDLCLMCVRNAPDMYKPKVVD